MSQKRKTIRKCFAPCTFGCTFQLRSTTLGSFLEASSSHTYSTVQYVWRSPSSTCFPFSIQLRSGSLASSPSGQLSEHAAAESPSGSGGGKKCTRAGGSSWSAVVNVVLIEGKDLLAMDFEGTSDPYCKFRSGKRRARSKKIYRYWRLKFR